MDGRLLGGVEEGVVINMLQKSGVHNLQNMKLRLDIGRARYELGRFGSMVRFFNIGRTIAYSKAKVICSCRQQHYNRSLTSEVGTGSNWHCLTGDFVRTLFTPSAVTCSETEQTAALRRYGVQCLVVTL